MEGFLEQIVNNSRYFAYFQTTTYKLKNMDAHMATLKQNLQLDAHMRIDIHILEFHV